MGALTHNGEVMQGLPANASQINFDNTGTDITSTQAENAIKEVNAKANTNATAINGLASGLASKAKVININVPVEKTDISGFLGHILGTIIDEQEIGSYVVMGAWDTHDYYTGLVYKLASNNAIGIIHYGTDNLALYSGSYMSGQYIRYKEVQYRS